ncbi:MAG: glycosyltransferase family 2 protein [Chitinophagaceae bacterium]
MLISIVIVNYNVPLFLEQCLHSVKYALEGTEGEVIVVDNASADNSMRYLPPRFPWVKFMQNEMNEGFGKANNRALAAAKGKYILFLNPDTLVTKETFDTCFRFLEEHPEAGAVGVRMLDGNGKFLRESKRSFPDPLTSFYKLAGLSSLFPRSKRFARYHLGHLPADEPAEVDVLAGAFMMVKKTVLEKTGGFDPAFFMYGEDIDLSFRIQKAGYKNFYLPVPIVHFKGESTRKGSLNYVRMFYQAMRVFVEKHYSGGGVGLFRAAIKLAISGRAAISALRRFMLKLGLPLLDLLAMLVSFGVLLLVWQTYIKPGIDYSGALVVAAALGSALVAMIVHYWGGLYYRKIRFFAIPLCAIIQLPVVLSIYALLPETLRFSRGMLASAQLLFYLFTWMNRKLLVWMDVLEEEKEAREYRAIVIGSEVEMKRIAALIASNGKKTELLGNVSLEKNMLLESPLPYDEVICCFGEIPMQAFLEKQPAFSRNVRVLYSASGSESIVGSESANEAGEAYSGEYATRLATPREQRNKRLTAVLIAVYLLVSWPLLAFIIPKPFGLLGNIFRVLSGAATWIGYAGSGKELPQLPEGILTTTSLPGTLNSNLGNEVLEALDKHYAREYSFRRDIALTRKGFYHLGAKNQ